jgi:hypothetical protein
MRRLLLLGVFGVLVAGCQQEPTMENVSVPASAEVPDQAYGQSEPS